jgi:hypothetical protein
VLSFLVPFTPGSGVGREKAEREAAQWHTSKVKREEEREEIAIVISYSD